MYIIKEKLFSLPPLCLSLVTPILLDLRSIITALLWPFLFIYDLVLIEHQVWARPLVLKLLGLKILLLLWRLLTMPKSFCLCELYQLMFIILEMKTKEVQTYLLSQLKIAVINIITLTYFMKKYIFQNKNN